MPPKYQLSVKFLDCVLEDDMEGQLPTARIGCFVQYGGKFVDVLMIREGAQMIKSDTLTLPLEEVPDSLDPKVVFIIKDIQEDEPYVGSVSVFKSVFMDGNLGQTYPTWITLFDDQGDDEYDGAMGLNDDEDPRVQLEFMITQIPEPSAIQQPVPVRKSIPDQPKSNQPNYLNPIKNQRDKRDSAGTINSQTAPITPGRTVNKVSSKPIVKPTSAARASKFTKPITQAPIEVSRDPISSKLGRLAPVKDVSTLLNQNNDKRQNVNYLKGLLDSQLNTLCSNLKIMQSDNSEIETETIQRLQIIDKFGNDASNGLQMANQENMKLLQDLQEQKTQHKEVTSDQLQQQNQMKKQLNDLEKSLKMLQQDLDAKQQGHKVSMLQKQEMLQIELNEMQPPKGSKSNIDVRGSPKRKEDMNDQRQNLEVLIGQKSDGVNALRDLRRQIPSLAADFQFEVDKLSANIEVLVEENSDLKGEIICLEEEFKSQKLISKLEDERMKTNEFEIKQNQQRADQLEEELNEFIDRGDNQYNQLRQETREQDEIEQTLTEEINTVANKSNMLLRAKLNSNKGDFDRLRQGATGNELERRVAFNDQSQMEILAIKKDAHKGLIEIRDVMKCDIGKNQQPYVADLSQVEQSCKLLDEKDAELYRLLMPEKDQKTKEYLANQVSNGLRDIMNGDKVDIEQHIDFNQSGMDKLHKMTEKHALVKDKQRENFVIQKRTIASMDDQISILREEKQATLDSINKHKRELEELRRLRAQKVGKVEDLDQTILDLEARIEQLYDDMEKLEEEIAIKNEIIADLQAQLNALLNRKPAPKKPKNQFYVPVKNDIVDERLADYINEFGSPVPWKRISEGNYIYGTKKVSVKYMRNHLIIKVGGGSMMAEEFVANYEDIELAKINYANPGTGVSANPELSHLSKQQKVALARGVSPRGSVLGSPKGANKSTLGTEGGYKRAGSGQR